MNPKIDERIEDEYEAKIKGEFKIYLGNKLYTKGKNTWTALFCESLCAALLPNGDTNNYTADTTLRFASYRMDARVGTDTSTPTEPTMSDLVSKVDTPPDSKNSVIFKNVDYTKYWSRHKFVWNAGTLPDMTIGEFGVYLYLGDDSWSSPMLNPHTGEGIYDPYGNSSKRLASRIASADGSFDAFEFCGSIDPLTFKWRFQVAIT